MNRQDIPTSFDSAGLPVVTQADIVRALQTVGVVPGQILLIHSSLKSFGRVSGGAPTVIQAACEAVTADGTVVFPTLVQRDFAHAYENWDPARSPSDVGLVSETFRLMPGTLRSDQATHSVAARGRQAAELTFEHSAYGPRMGVFGDYCFSWSSPWQKMYLYGARICFLGVGTRFNTFKHFVEYCFVEACCQQIQDPWMRCQAMAEIRRHNTDGVWPFLNSDQTDVLLQQRGLISQASCGRALLTSFRADDFYNTIYPVIKDQSGNWFDERFVGWYRRFVVDADLDHDSS